MEFFDINFIVGVVNDVLDELYINEKYLFDNNLSERDIVYHFGWYFRKKQESYFEFKEYSIDVDYNRNDADIKLLNFYGNEHRILPDFILHKRGNNSYNLLAIEFKKNKSMDKKDFYKLEWLTKKDYLYKYKLGLFIKLAKKRELVEITYFVDGKIFDKNS